MYVPDPTLLLGQSEYQGLSASKYSAGKPYLFSYILGVDNALVAKQANSIICTTLGIGCFNAYSLSLIRNIINRGFGAKEMASPIRQIAFCLNKFLSWDHF